MPTERPDTEKRKILEEARKRFARARDWESKARTRFLDDLKFAEGDSYNNFQWPNEELDKRTKRPSLTINRVRQHNLDILNDARQSRVAVKLRAVRGGASYDSAQILNGVIKHIEYISNADSAYQHALSYAVRAGIGWIRLVTDYVGDDSLDQEIYIRRVPDPLTVLLDCDISEFDGSDARWGFVFTEMPRDQFERAHPKFADTTPDSEIGAGQSWVGVNGTDKVRIAEYFRCVEKDGKLYSFVDPQTGERVTKSEKDVDKELLKLVIDDPSTAYRTVVERKVEHFTIIGDQIAEEKEWPGKYIPLLRCVGEETVIDGQLDRKGHTRALLDAQRMANYNASASVEFGALQTKAPWLAPAAAIEEYQKYWDTANTENWSVLPWQHIDDDGNTIPPPSRPNVPTGAPVFVQGFQIAIDQMRLASGQNQADFGEPGNERSGVAIEQRQREGDKATYHYLDHQASMIRYLGKQFLDLWPKIYDTERLLFWRDDAGNEQQVKFDPTAEQHFSQETDQEGNKIAVINPKLGVYDVQADVGPSFATQREAAFTAFSQLLSQNKELISIVGDIWMRFADIPGAEEAAQRLKRMVPQQALTDGPPPDVQALRQQVQTLTGVVQSLDAKLKEKAGDIAAKAERNTIDAYRATTDRVAALKEALATDPHALLVLVREVLEEAQFQSAGGGAEDHAAQPIPEQDQLHPALGGQLPPPQIPAAPEEEAA